MFVGKNDRSMALLPFVLSKTFNKQVCDHTLNMFNIFVSLVFSLE